MRGSGGGGQAKGGQDHRESPGRKGSTREGVGWKGRSGGLKEGRGQVDGAGPEQWVESTGMGGAKPKGVGPRLRNGASSAGMERGGATKGVGMVGVES